MKPEIYRVKEDFKLPRVDRRSHDWYVKGIKAGILVVVQGNTTGQKRRMTKMGCVYEWLYMSNDGYRKIWLDWEQFKDKFEPVLIEQLTFFQQSQLVYTLHNWSAHSFIEILLKHRRTTVDDLLTIIDVEENKPDPVS